MSNRIAARDRLLRDVQRVTVIAASLAVTATSALVAGLSLSSTKTSTPQVVYITNPTPTVLVNLPTASTSKSAAVVKAPVASPKAVTKATTKPAATSGGS